MTSLATLALVLLPGAPPASPVDYERQIKPLFVRTCVACHGPDKQRGSLRLDSYAALKAGGTRGPAFVAGKSADSVLFQALAGDGVAIPNMPPKEPRLTAAEVALVRAWIDEGAKGPASETVQGVKGRDHWAFQPIRRPALPEVADPAWCRNPIDRFVLARLEKEKVRPSPEADPVTLLRRLSLDLTGLPPTPEEVAAFEQTGYDRAVERLLASPHYGERWGRWWLDQARYADSNGYSIDSARTIWPYRDWVVRSLNADQPFDRFTIEQLAGDLLPSATLEQKVATGFHRNTQKNEEGGIDIEQFRIESVIDRVNTTGSVWLGLTVGCCQCHDHKFDPVSQREYYQLFAFFNGQDEPALELTTPADKQARIDHEARRKELDQEFARLDPATAQHVATWEAQLTDAAKAKLPADVRRVLGVAASKRTAAQKAALASACRPALLACETLGALTDPYAAAAVALASVQREEVGLERYKFNLSPPPPVSTTLVMQERGTPRATNVLIAGDFTRKGTVVTPATPAVLPPLPAKEKRTRLDLANWLVDGKNPLTARVIVNRVWQVYFGTGLVETENDFGTQGTKPTHPELLDWLADEFMASGWSLKHLHQLIVSSATYRQSSKARPDLATLDPRNRLLARQTRLRLEAELVRDVSLAASGLLSPQMGGPTVYPPQPAGVSAFTQVARLWKASTGPDRYRRAIYTEIRRSAAFPALTVFDAPDGGVTCTRRNRSNTPLQALTLLNDEAFVEIAVGLAKRITSEAQGDAERLDHAFRVCLGRPPRATERAVLERLIAKQRQAGPGEAGKVPATREDAAWLSVARVLLNLDEFITRE
jgi:mono/diheme cytochrome c family protein